MNTAEILKKIADKEREASYYGNLAVSCKKLGKLNKTNLYNHLYNVALLEIRNLKSRYAAAVKA